MPYKRLPSLLLCGFAIGAGLYGFYCCSDIDCGTLDISTKDNIIEKVSEEENNDAQKAKPKDNQSTIGEEYEKLLQNNKDLVGWISIDGTRIDYPVLRSSFNDFYLTRDANKEPNAHGSIFLDSSEYGISDFSVIHGHNMADGTMFHDLMKYTDYSFYKKYPYINIYDGSIFHKYKIFTVFKTENDFKLRTDFESDADKVAYLQTLSSLSMFDDNFINSNIILLNTCTNIGSLHLIVGAYSIEEED